MGKRSGRPIETWLVVIRSAWREDELPGPVAPDGRDRAARLGSRLVVEPDAYELHFTVEASEMFLASWAATARWSRIVEQARLPLWPIVDMTISEAGDTAVVDLRRSTSSRRL